MLEELQSLQEDRTKTFFTAQDVTACYAALDPNNTGSVTAQQYAHALKSLGVDAPADPLPEDVSSLDKKTFLEKVASEVGVAM